MGFVRSEDARRAELEEFRRMLLSCASVHRRKDGGDGSIGGIGGQERVRDGDLLDRMVCVTSGVSYVGTAIVNQLLVNGYSVRIIVDHEEDVEKLREMEISGEMRLNSSIVEVVMANLSEVDSLIEAFEGCRCVFHTSAFVDPSGLSGYTKALAHVEANSTKNVIEACGASPSVRHCVLTSSLLTCIWQDHNNIDQDSCLIDHKSWSDESVCTDKKLWYALGKLRSEKAAWEIARQNGVKLASICPGLITGPRYYQRNPTCTIAYLKGAQEMFVYGLLATVDVEKLAKAHVRVFEEMVRKKTGLGRYLCFGEIIERGDEIEKLALETGIDAGSIVGGASSSNRTRFQLSNSRLVNLMLSTRRCCND